MENEPEQSSEVELEDRRAYFRQADDLDSGAAQELLSAGFDLTLSPVYDIINAGPRRRFTADGYLVSNSAYGATGATLERKIQADTGVLPPEGTGDRILDALQRRQPIATQWLNDLEEIPKAGGTYIAESGAKRRFIGHANNIQGVNWRTTKSILSSAGRQMRNFPEQNIVASSSARAGKHLQGQYRALKMHAWVMITLYDSAVSVCPIEERFIVQKMHQRYLTEENVWHNHDRTWHLTSSGAFGFAWSSPVAKEQRKLLEDPTWHSVAPWVLPE